MKKIRINTEEFLNGEDKMFFAFFFGKKSANGLEAGLPHERKKRERKKKIILNSLFSGKTETPLTKISAEKMKADIKIWRG